MSEGIMTLDTKERRLDKYNSVFWIFMFAVVILESGYNQWRFKEMTLEINELRNQQFENMEKLKEYAINNNNNLPKGKVFATPNFGSHLAMIRLRRNVQNGNLLLDSLHAIIQKIISKNIANGKVCQNKSIVCIKGDKGERGQSGTVGSKGQKGGPGDIGATGAKGVPGLIGPIGPKGQRGNRGPRGKPGPLGFKGQKGDHGFIGATGAQGARGLIGPTGLKGHKGEPGAKGRSIEKPRIISKWQLVVSKPELTNFTLHCAAQGNPQPKLRWEFHGRKTDSRYMYPLNDALEIKTIQQKDAGSIKCIAENILGTAEIETRLNVLTKPRIKFIGRKVLATVGLPVAITCNATGNPTPKLIWKKAFGLLRGEQALSKDGQSLQLKLNTPVIEDSGYYVCVAENHIGKTSQSVLIDVEVNDRNCDTWRKSGYTRNGVYTINPDGGLPFSVYCDMTTAGGGWTIIQRRVNGKVDFFRNWVDYKNGFGNLEEEFWLGNDKIHRLTKQKDMKIRFDLEDVAGEKAFAEYGTFYIDGEDKQYMAHVTSYSGTAGDSFSGTNGLKFSTKDKDHDTASSSCANQFHGAWWYAACHSSNLNGKYLNGPHKSPANGVNWYHFKGYYNSLKKTEMKLKPRK
eukprot:Seg3086.3 transcript_id=Seg3086.3/GoldUCD/mRNA.D3Y31 product=Ficolin-2 protein_id=Seg3086.3/GoldUCD/D3Y31